LVEKASLPFLTQPFGKENFIAISYPTNLVEKASHQFPYPQMGKGASYIDLYQQNP